MPGYGNSDTITRNLLKEITMTTIQTIFTENAENLLIGETGLVQFDYGNNLPNIGDKLTIRTSPSNKILSFVCQERHFDFSVKGESVLSLLFDVCP